MFNILASYLLGAQNTSSADEAEENNNLRLTSVISDDDWVVVDRDDRDSEGNSEVESNTSENPENCDNLDDHHHLPSLLTRSSSTSSLPCTTIDESWYITPPPCFTSAGPILMETSSLENLLIEHPSMSVYQHSQRGSNLLRHRLETVPVFSVERVVETANNVETSEETPVQRIQERSSRSNTDSVVPLQNRLEIFRQQEKQRIKVRQAQKVQIQKMCQSLKRKYLERNNKAREVNNRNWRPRRGERSQGIHRSYANNNRKC